MAGELDVSDRLRGWFAACVRAAVRSLPYAGEYRYSVVSCNFAAQTLDLNPLDPGQKPLVSIKMRTPGLQIELAPGAEVLVGYAAMDPTRPEVRAYSQDPSAVTRVRILGEVTPVALKGMSVRVTVPPGTFLTNATGLGVVPVPNPSPVDVDGTITEGSSVIYGG